MYTGQWFFPFIYISRQIFLTEFLLTLIKEKMRSTNIWRPSFSTVSMDNESEASRFQRLLGQSAYMFSVWLAKQRLGFCKDVLLFWSRSTTSAKFLTLRMATENDWIEFIDERSVSFRYFYFVFKTANAKALFRRQIRVSRHDSDVFQ